MYGKCKIFLYSRKKVYQYIHVIQISEALYFQYMLKKTRGIN